MIAIKNLSIPTTFGYPLNSWQIGNTSADALAILMPGFLDSKDYPHLKQLGEELADNGWLAIGFDALGVWGSKAPIELYTMSNWLSEIEQLIAWAKHRYSSIDKVVVVGHSMGGKLSLHYAATHPEITAAVSIMGGPDFVRSETYQKRMIEWKAQGVKISYRDLPDDSVQTIEIELPFAFVKDSLQHKLSKICTQIKCPTLLIAAENDSIVLTSQMQEVANQLEKNLTSLKIFPNMAHDYRKKNNDIKRVNEMIIQYLKTKL